MAILNADNAWFDLLHAEALRVGAQVRTFGSAATCDARLLEITTGHETRIVAEIEGRALDFPILQTGIHWGLNSLAVLLMLEALDVDRETAISALGSYAPLGGRGAESKIHAPRGAFVLVDDSYNANPISMEAALATLGARKVFGRRIIALTDMLELGPDAAQLHADLAAPIEAADVDLVFCSGPLMKSLWDALPPTRQGGYAETAALLEPQLVRAVEPGDVVMVKGSKGSKAHALAAALAALDGPSGGAA